jgi:hypothetical protein
MKKRHSAEERLNILLEKQKDLAKELNDARRAVSKDNRKRDAKRKVLAGACILHLVETNRFPKEAWQSNLDGFLTRPEDRILFGLPVPEDKE